MAPVVEKAFYMINSPPSIKHDVTCNLNGEGGGAACDASRLESIFRHRLIVLFRTHIFPTSRRQRPASSHLLQVPAAAKNVEKNPETDSRLVSRPLSRDEAEALPCLPSGEKRPYRFPLASSFI